MGGPRPISRKGLEQTGVPEKVPQPRPPLSLAPFPAVQSLASHGPGLDLFGRSPLVPSDWPSLTSTRRLAQPPASTQACALWRPNWLPPGLSAGFRDWPWIPALLCPSGLPRTMGCLGPQPGAQACHAQGMLGSSPDGRTLDGEVLPDSTQSREAGDSEAIASLHRCSCPTSLGNCPWGPHMSSNRQPRPSRRLQEMVSLRSRQDMPTMRHGTGPHASHGTFTIRREHLTEKNLSLREVKQLGQGHTARGSQITLVLSHNWFCPSEVELLQGGSPRVEGGAG